MTGIHARCLAVGEVDGHRPICQRSKGHTKFRTAARRDHYDPDHGGLTWPPTPEELRPQVGDEVFVITTRGGVKTPRPARGKIIKVGRTLVTIEYENAWGRKSADKFYMDSGTKNDGYNSAYYLTPEEMAERERRNRAMDVLRKHQVSLGMGHSLTLGQIEALAAVLDPEA